MSITIDNGYTDTIATTLNIVRPDLSWSTDFAEMNRKADGVNNELTLVNLTSPSDRLETVYVNVKQLPDVYTKSGIDIAYWSKSKKGLRIYSQEKSIKKITDTDLDSQVYVPVNVGISIECGNHESLTADMLMAAVSRAAAALFDTGLTTSSRISRLTKGALQPK